mgnify:CR=1 FL=1
MRTTRCCLRRTNDFATSSLLVALLAIAACASSFVTPALAGGLGRERRCPPVPTVSDVSIEAYASKPWYVQAQLPNRYQPVENLFCVRAVYTVTSPTTLDVFNFARKGSVEGEPSNEDMVLNAFIPDVDVKSKLKVGPKFVPKHCTAIIGSSRTKKKRGGPLFLEVNLRFLFPTVCAPRKAPITCVTKAAYGCLRERRRFPRNSSKR